MEGPTGGSDRCQEWGLLLCREEATRIRRKWNWEKLLMTTAADILRSSLRPVTISSFLVGETLFDLGVKNYHLFRT